MVLIRPVRATDLDSLYKLANEVSAGMTTLPADRDALKKKIDRSVESFAAEISTPGPQYYLLVMEDPQTGEIGGTSAIFASIGLEKPFYSYSLTRNTHVSSELKAHKTHDVLTLVNDYMGYAEVGTLYLSPGFRKGNNGRALARSRYLLMAQHPERFGDRVVAEIRGWQDESGQSPFWEAVGKQFFEMEFDEADHLSAISNNQFIADLMPKYPVYVTLLPKQAQRVIGVPNDEAAPALSLLKKEGFRYERHVDIFDGGPCVEARVRDLKAIRDAKRAIVDERDEKASANGMACLIASGDRDRFRVVECTLTPTENGRVILSAEAMKEADLKPGQEILYVPLR